MNVILAYLALVVTWPLAYGLIVRAIIPMAIRAAQSSRQNVCQVLYGIGGALISSGSLSIVVSMLAATLNQGSQGSTSLAVIMALGTMAAVLFVFGIMLQLAYGDCAKGDGG